LGSPLRAGLPVEFSGSSGILDADWATIVASAVHRDLSARPRSAWIWISVASAAVVITGMAYSLWWAAVVRHSHGYWITPGDIWFSVRTAHWIGWGSLSFVYSNQRSELITLPGFEVLLTPFVLLSSALGFSENAPGLFPNIHPQAWLLIGPLSLASGTVAIVAFDGLARRTQVDIRIRNLLTVLEAAAIWPALALWGHPEDALAIGLSVFAFSKVLDDRWVAAGWLLGAAIAMQLFAVFLVPAFLAIIGLRRGVALLARAAILPGFLFVAVAVPDFHDAVRTLLDQPAFPIGNHATPWVAMSPRLARGVVAGGPIRLCGVAVALGVAPLARKIRSRPAAVVWLMAVALGARCIFDPVMVPYYVMPCVTLALIAAATNGWRFTFTIAAGAGLTVMTFTHHGEWPYWLMMTAIMFAMLATAWPSVPPAFINDVALSRGTTEPRRQGAIAVSRVG